jgi:hypothetical protein
MTIIAWLFLVGSLIFASPSLADWTRSCQTGFTASSIGGGGSFVCHNPTGANDDPSVLDVSACENVDIFWYDDVANGAASTGTAAVFTCPVVANAILDTEAERQAGCQPLNGGTTLSAANTEVQGLGAVRIWVDLDANSTASNQLLVRCAQPSGR